VLKKKKNDLEQKRKKKEFLEKNGSISQNIYNVITKEFFQL